MQQNKGASAQVIDAALADPAELFAVLHGALGSDMASFVVEHRDWVYGPGGGLGVIVDQEVTAGCCGWIRSVCHYKGVEVPARWGAHEHVLPRFRGRGLWRLCGGEIPQDGTLLLAFTSKAGARVHVKAGFGLREDPLVLRAPLYPGALLRVQAAAGVRGAVYRTGALGLSALAKTFRSYAARYVPKATEIVDSPDPLMLERIFRMWAIDELVTTVRSAEFLEWRYFEAPYQTELVFYLTGPRDRPSYYAIVRYMPYADSTKARILDIFGDFSDPVLLCDLLRTIVRDASRRGALFVEMISTWPGLTRAARLSGLLASEGRRFVWGCKVSAIHGGMSQAWVHWTQGDGDMDHLG